MSSRRPAHADLRFAQRANTKAKQQDDHEALGRRIDGVSDEVKAEADRLERERKQRLTHSLDWEEAGIWTFAFGLILTTVGAIV
jgi:hypothetical protein